MGDFRPPGYLPLCVNPSPKVTEPLTPRRERRRSSASWKVVWIATRRLTPSRCTVTAQHLRPVGLVHNTSMACRSVQTDSASTTVRPVRRGEQHPAESYRSVRKRRIKVARQNLYTLLGTSCSRTAGDDATEATKWLPGKYPKDKRTETEQVFSFDMCPVAHKVKFKEQ